MRIIQVLSVNDSPFGAETVDLRLPAVTVVAVEVLVVDADAPIADAHGRERLSLYQVQLVQHARYA